MLKIVVIQVRVHFCLFSVFSRFFFYSEVFQFFYNLFIFSVFPDFFSDKSFSIFPHFFFFLDSGPNSDSEGELNEEEEMSRIEAETQAKLAQEGTKPKPKKLQDRKTKEAAMKEIYSESQRIFRQSGMQVGYHRPKQRTLEEFLQRKKKQVIDQVIGDDLKIRKVSVNTELERKLEECEKATEEFYKNDEDEEDDEGVEQSQENSETEKGERRVVFVYILKWRENLSFDEF